jgi:hypothetical protein
MIILIKGNNYKQLAIKGVSFLTLFFMFYLYYGHMSDKFAEQNKQLESKLVQQNTTQNNNKSLKYESIILKEAHIIVDLIDQKNIQSIKIKKGALSLVCDYNTDIEPLLIRYGVNAFVKHTSKNIKILIDLETIVENKYENS